MKNLFVVGLDPFNRELLEALPEATEVRFHALLDYAEVRGQSDHPVEQLLALCEQRLAAFQGRIDGFIGFLDFPVSLMVPLLCERYGTPGPDYASVLRCEHKLWSRMLQRQVIPESVPYFAGFDPFDERPVAGLDLLPPFWVKPVKSFRSYLAYLINDEASFDVAMDETRRHIAKLAGPAAIRRVLCAMLVPLFWLRFRPRREGQSSVGISQLTNDIGYRICVVSQQAVVKSPHRLRVYKGGGGRGWPLLGVGCINGERQRRLA